MAIRQITLAALAATFVAGGASVASAESSVGVGSNSATSSANLGSGSTSIRGDAGFWAMDSRSGANARASVNDPRRSGMKARAKTKVKTGY